VYEEILQGIHEGNFFLNTVDKIAEEDWTILETPKSQQGRKLIKKLLDSVGYGEAAGIVLAKEQGLLFFIDDKKARKIAKQERISVSGTLGTLKLAVEGGVISIEETDEVLKEMIRGGYRSPIQSMTELFEMEEEGLP